MKSNLNHFRAPLIGVAAALATVVTMGLAVFGPVTLADNGCDPSRSAVAAVVTKPAAAEEVDIVPGRIEVVGVRDQNPQPVQLGDFQLPPVSREAS